jgi:hypothetical protein
MLTMDIYTIADRCTMTLTLCMIIPWSRDGVVFLAFGHFAMSSHLPCPGSTDAHCPPLGARGPRPQRGVPSPRVHTHSLSRVQNMYLYIIQILDAFASAIPICTGKRYVFCINRVWSFKLNNQCRHNIKFFTKYQQWISKQCSSYVFILKNPWISSKYLFKLWITVRIPRHSAYTERKKLGPSSLLSTAFSFHVQCQMLVLWRSRKKCYFFTNGTVSVYQSIK